VKEASKCAEAGEAIAMLQLQRVWVKQEENVRRTGVEPLTDTQKYKACAERLLGSIQAPVFTRTLRPRVCGSHRGCDDLTVNIPHQPRDQKEITVLREQPHHLHIEDMTTCICGVEAPDNRLAGRSGSGYHNSSRESPMCAEFVGQNIPSNQRRRKQPVISHLVEKIDASSG